MAEKDTRMKSIRTPAEQQVGERIADMFARCTDRLEDKLASFPKYARRQDLNRFLAMYELFQRVLPVKGSVVDLGVFRGFSLMTWAKLSAILEPENFMRRIYGFDTFDGFPSIHAKDDNSFQPPELGEYRASSHDELLELIEQYDADRFLGHMQKVELIQGEISETVPRFLETHPHVVVSLLFVDCDLYEPTLAALKALRPRMPRGAVLAFDELDNPVFPGETLAVLEALGLQDLRLERLPWQPRICFAVL